MYVDRLKIKNMRGFEQAEMRLNYPGRKYPRGTPPPRLQNVNLLLGENGSGKSTVCRALCIGTLREYLNVSGFISNDNIRHGETESEVTVGLRLHRWDRFIAELGAGKTPPEVESETGITNATGTTHIRLQQKTEILEVRDRAKQLDDALFFGDTVALFIAAYGANRRTERPEAYNETLRKPRYRQVATLFESHVGLIPFESAFGAIANSSYNVVARLDDAVNVLNQLLPQPVRLVRVQASHRNEALELILNRPSWQFDTGKTLLEYLSLSDGYRSFLSWVLDLVVCIARAIPQNSLIKDHPGVVIVDEVDLLLHPAWQRTVIETIATAFPNLQFVFSTHSPIVAATLDAANIFVTRDGKIEQYTEPIAGKGIDATLTSPYFRLASPLSPEIERDLSKLAERAMEGDFEASLHYLRLLHSGNDAAIKADNGA